MNSEDSPDIISFFIDLFLHAFQNNLKVRILQGTFSHDRQTITVYPLEIPPVDFTPIQVLDKPAFPLLREHANIQL